VVYLRDRGVIQALQTGPEGLSDVEARRRLNEFGFNELREGKGASPLQIFLSQFKDIFVIMLLIAISISFLIGENMNALTIAIIVGLNAVVGFVQEFRSEKALEAMKKLTAPQARVMRGGKDKAIPAKEVVPGDIIILETGDRVPADSRVIEGVELRTNEALLTGESTPVKKVTTALNAETSVADKKNMIFMATHTVYGRGKAVVTTTGMGTEFGKIATMVQAIETEQTPLKLRLDRFAKRLGILVGL